VKCRFNEIEVRSFINNRHSVHQQSPTGPTRLSSRNNGILTRWGRLFEAQFKRQPTDVVQPFNCGPVLTNSKVERADRLHPFYFTFVISKS
jgi:hypothetical protein